MEELEFNEQPKKEVKKKVKDPKKDLANQLEKMANTMKKTVKEERASLNTASCAKINKAAQDLLSIVRYLNQ